MRAAELPPRRLLLGGGVWRSVQGEPGRGHALVNAARVALPEIHIHTVMEGGGNVRYDTAPWQCSPPLDSVCSMVQCGVPH